MHAEPGCEQCRALELRCVDLERRLAQAEQRAARGGRVRPEVADGADLDLTTRELEVLQLIAQGLSTDEIGEELYLSRNSVKTHTRKLYRKLGVSNRTEAAIWALHRPGPDGHGPPCADGQGSPSPDGRSVS